jgi:exopolysaccharide biosynthesis polyprenyl glycosylphosphotransferase
MLMPNPKKNILFIGDILVLYFSLWLTLLIRYWPNFDITRFNQHFWPFTIIYFVWLIVFYIAGLYALDLARNNLGFYSTFLKALTLNAALAVAFFYFIPFFGITPKINLFLNLLILSVLISGWRHFYNYFLKSEIFLNNILVIGQTKETEQMIDWLKTHPQLGYRLTQEIKPNNIQTPFDLLEIASEKNIKTIITAIDPHQNTHLAESLYQCLPLKISFSDFPNFYEKIMGRVPLSSVGEIWFLENLTESQKNFYEASKRIMDMTGALIFGLISLAFYPLIAFIIKTDSRGPVFIKQRRVGQDGQPFILYKFRTMRATAKDGSSEPGGRPIYAQINDPRNTRMGKIFRKIRLDELPQLWNIFLGQMSFIGPRAERVEFVEELEKQIPYYQIRHIIKPGLSGWAQVNFRYGASVEDSIEKLQYELYYIKHRSFILDLSIALRTISIILKGVGQ